MATFFFIINLTLTFAPISKPYFSTIYRAYIIYQALHFHSPRSKMAYSNSYILFLLGVSVILSSQVLAYNRPSESSLNYGEELDEQKGLDYVNAPKMNEELEAKKGMDYVNAPKIVSYEMPLEDTTYVAYEMPLEHTSSSSAEINDGGLDYIKVPRTDEKIVDSVDLVKAPKIDEKFDDNQKSIDSVESVNVPKIDEKFDDNQNGVDSVKASKIDEKLDDEKDVDSSKFSKIDETLNDQKGVDWVSFHARYPWIKKNSLTTGSRKLLLNHIANDQSA
ncbi:hypothetical protein KIW84_054856 [Lathyrus oleraceus]|uniref:Uncharacterized protein n=1 Tax=Pisum sativum TaxID=3888 RepID=A0A9D4WU64_PEA|nr:hypothetical protein KIW84_054856 [Pisum sativum]